MEGLLAAGGINLLKVIHRGVRCHVTVDSICQIDQSFGMLDASKIKCKKLRRLCQRGDERGIRADWLPRIKRILSALNVASGPDELNMPSYGWHKLKENRKDTFSVIVSKNWRITYKWSDHGPYDVNLEDYHGK
jgi:proteic killer suppression protein